MADPITNTDDVSSTVIEASHDTQFQQNQQWASQFASDASLNPTVQPQQDDPTAVAKLVTDQQDPLALRIFKGIGHGIAAGASDIARGTVEGPREALGGARDALQNTLGALDGAAKWMNEQAGDGKLDGIVKALDIKLPDVDRPTTVTSSVSRYLSNFVTGFIPALKGVRLATGGKAIAAGANALQYMAAGFINDFFAFPAHQKRLSDFVQQAEKEGLGVSDPVTKYLQSDPSDGEAEGRFKNALEGTLGGLAADAVVTTVGALRAYRIAKGVKVGTEGFGLEPVPGKPGGDRTAVPTTLGDPKAPLIAQEGIDGVATKEIAPDQLGQHINYAAIQGPEDINRVVNQYVKAIRMSNDGRSLDEILAAKGVEQGPPGTRVRSTTNAVARDLKTSGIDINDEVVQQASERLGISPEAFRNSLNRAGSSQAFKKEQAQAVNFMLDDLNKRVIEMGNKAASSASDELLHDFDRINDIHMAVYGHFRGDQSMAGTLLRRSQAPTGTTAKQIAAIQDKFMEKGGPDKLRQLARAVGGINDPDQVPKVLRPGFMNKVSDSIIEGWYFDLLSGFKTHAANVLSNSLMTVYQIPERALAAQFSKLRGAGDGVADGEATSMFFGMINGMKDAFRASGRTLMTGERADIFADNLTSGHVRIPAISSSNYGIDKNKNIISFVLGHAVDGFGSIIRFPTRAIMSQDEFFRVLGKSMEIHAQSFRKATQEEGLVGEAAAARIAELVANPSLEMLDSAKDFSRMITFSEPLGSVGRNLQSALNQIPPPLNIVGRQALPFLKTPVNIVKQGLGARTPLALLSRKFYSDIQAGGAQSDLALAKISLGSMLALVAVDQVWKNNVTGYGPTDPELQANWRMKNQPFSVKVPNSVIRAVEEGGMRLGSGGFGLFADKIPYDGAGPGYTWVSYNRLDPFGLILGAAASYAELSTELYDGERQNLATAIAVATSKSILNKSYTKGPSDFLDAMQQPERYADGWFKKSLGTLFVPSVIGQITQSIDPEWRDVHSLLDGARSRVPGFGLFHTNNPNTTDLGDLANKVLGNPEGRYKSLGNLDVFRGAESLPPRVNLWGEHIMFQGGLGPDIVSPVYTMKQVKDPATDLVVDNHIRVGMPAKTQFEVELTPKEYYEFASKSGKRAHEEITNMITSGEFNGLSGGPDGMKAKIVEDTIRGMREAVKAEMLDDPAHKDLADRVQRAIDLKSNKLMGVP